MAKSKANETMSTAMELTQNSAKVTLKASVKAAELTENYVQGVYKAGYDANYDALKVAKNYWDATTEIRQDWLDLFAKTGEDLIDATAKMEVPTIGDVTKFGKGVYNTVEKSVGNLTAKATAATK